MTEANILKALHVLRLAESDVERHAIVGGKVWCKVAIRPQGDFYAYSLTADRLVFPNAEGKPRCLYAWAYTKGEAVKLIQKATAKRQKLFEEGR